MDSIRSALHFAGGLLPTRLQVLGVQSFECGGGVATALGPQAITRAAGAGACLNGCVAQDIQLGSFELVSSEACDGSRTHVNITGTMEDTNVPNRYDVELWVGPTGDMCNVYSGFTCVDQAIASADAHGDDACVDVPGHDTAFNGFTLTVPCEGNGDASLEVEYCFAWQELAPGVSNICKGVDGVVRSSSTSECGCGSFVVDEVKVCPVAAEISVGDVAVSGDGYCRAEGTVFDIPLVGIPADFLGSYAIKQGAEEIVASGAPLTGNTISASLAPGGHYEIELTLFHGDPTRLVCSTVALGLVPTCGCDVTGCPRDLICGDRRDVCDARLGDTSASAGRHMTGFLGQHFDFVGEDGGWYSLVGDPLGVHVNMRVTSPIVDLPETTYVTGLSVLTTDASGVDRAIVVEVEDPHSLDSSCPAGVSPCLADGSLRVVLDGHEIMLAPGTVSLGPGVKVTAVNLPAACRPVGGFEKHRDEPEKLESARHDRHLSEPRSMGEWILRDPTAANSDECVEHVARAEVEDGGLFAHQSEHASFQIVTPKASIRLSHGRLHRLAMRDPPDQYDLPDHSAWQMNMAVDHIEMSRYVKGVLGETFVPTRDASGKPIITGMEAIRGETEDYRVDGAYSKFTRTG